MLVITDFASVPLFVRTPDFQLSSKDISPLFSLRGHYKMGKLWQVPIRAILRDLMSLVRSLKCAPHVAHGIDPWVVS